MMDDDADKASDYLETVTNYAIDNAKAKAKTPINTTGECTWCGEKVKDTRRWCSTECRDEFARYAKTK